jgi:hypothetical protein
MLLVLHVIHRSVILWWYYNLLFNYFSSHETLVSFLALVISVLVRLLPEVLLMEFTMYSTHRQVNFFAQLPTTLQSLCPRDSGKPDASHRKWPSSPGCKIPLFGLSAGGWPYLRLVESSTQNIQLRVRVDRYSRKPSHASDCVFIYISLCDA